MAAAASIRDLSRRSGMRPGPIIYSYWTQLWQHIWSGSFLWPRLWSHKHSGPKPPQPIGSMFERRHSLGSAAEPATTFCPRQPVLSPSWRGRIQSRCCPATCCCPLLRYMLSFSSYHLPFPFAFPFFPFVPFVLPLPLVPLLEEEQ